MVSRLLGNSTKVEDAIQDIMMKLWLKRHKFENHPNINGYVFLTAKNYCLDILRKQNPKVENPDYHFKYLHSDKEYENLEFKELNASILKILKKLPKPQQEVLIMRDLDGFEYNEIATVTQLKIEHVRVLLSRARKHVRIELQKNYCYER